MWSWGAGRVPRVMLRYRPRRVAGAPADAGVPSGWLHEGSGLLVGEDGDGVGVGDECAASAGCRSRSWAISRLIHLLLGVGVVMPMPVMSRRKARDVVERGLCRDRRWVDGQGSGSVEDAVADAAAVAVGGGAGVEGMADASTRCQLRGRLVLLCSIHRAAAAATWGVAEEVPSPL